MSGKYHVPESSAHPSAMSVFATYSGCRTIEYAPRVDNESAVGRRVPRVDAPCGAVPTTNARNASPLSATAKHTTSHANGVGRRPSNTLSTKRGTSRRGI